MNLIPLSNGDYFYSGDQNVIINGELKHHFTTLKQSQKIKTQSFDIHAHALQEKVINISQLSFETTRDCSLACKYCVFGGSYKHQRTNSKKYMEFDTAKKGLDTIYNIVKDRENKLFVLSFYGGEPLLNFHLIRQVVDYAKTLFKGWELLLFVTTNLTVLTEPMIRLFIDNDFKLTVSLDGPKDVQDVTRPFHDGSGSYDIVMKNIMRIKTADPDYFKKVGFTSVYSREQSMKKIYDYFTGNELLEDHNIRFNSVATQDTDYYQDIDYDENRVKEEYTEILKGIAAKLAQKEKLKPVEQNIMNRYDIMEELLKLRQTSTLAGTCLFDSKIFLDGDGKFHLCEKINNHFPFGDVDTGLDYEGMARMAREYTAVIEENCSDCVYRFLCTRCIISFAKDGQFEFDREFCKEKKKTIKNNLEHLVKIKNGEFN